jgi:hypothetical protein
MSPDIALGGCRKGGKLRGGYFRPFLGLLPTLILPVQPAPGGTVWNSPTSNHGFNAANWTAGVPTRFTDATINFFPTFQPLIGAGPAQVRNLTLNTGSTPTLGDGSQRQLFSSGGTQNINNSGTLTLASASLNLNANVVLRGTGSIIMTNSAANLISASTGFTITNAGNTVSGSGNLGGGMIAVVNQAGTISANQSLPLIIQAGNGGVTNSALMQATAGGTLIIFQRAINKPRHTGVRLSSEWAAHGNGPQDFRLARVNLHQEFNSRQPGGFRSIYCQRVTPLNQRLKSRAPKRIWVRIFDLFDHLWLRRAVLNL